MFEYILNNKWGDSECVKEYEQPSSGICHTLVIRWIKYQLVGNNKFWGTNEAKLASALARQAYHETQKQRMVEVQIGEASADFAFRTLAGQQAKRDATVPKQKKLKAAFPALERWDPATTGGNVHKIHKKTHTELTAAINRPGCASYIFLSAQGSDIGHVLGAYATTTMIHFFDPNMGEVKAPAASFADWLETLLDAWSSDDQYKRFDTYLVQPIRGVPRDRDTLDEIEAVQDGWVAQPY
jgi:hypothetical protein